MTWMSNNIHVKQWDVIIYPCRNFKGKIGWAVIEVRTLMSDYISQETMDVITYQC